MGYGVTGIAVPLPGSVTPYPVTEDVNGKGGWSEVADHATRDAILPTFRKQGMVVVTLNDGIPWQLIGGILNGNWATLSGIFYQTIFDSDSSALPQTPILQFGNGFTVLDQAGASTRVNLSSQQLPNVAAADIGDTLAVVTDGAGGAFWAKGANAFLSFATVTALNAYAGLKTAGMLSYVTATQCLYMLAADGATWQFFAPSPALASQAAWFVDISVGSDNNSGTAAGAGNALATAEELSRRLSPGFALYTPKQNTTITFAAGAYGELALNVDWPASVGNFGQLVNIVCAVTSVALTLSAVTNTAQPATRGQVTVSSGALVAGQRLRSTSGANIGAITYSTGSNGGSTTNHFVKTWYNYNTGVVVNIANATTIAQDTLAVSFSAKVQLASRGKGYVQLNDAILLNGGNWGPTNFNNNENGTIWIVGCELRGGGSSSFPIDYWGTAQYRNSRIFNLTGFYDGIHEMKGCAIQGLAIAYLHGTLRFSTADSNCFDAGSLCAGQTVATNDNIASGGSIDLFDRTEWENGTGINAITMKYGGVCAMGDTAWGVSTAYAVGVRSVANAFFSKRAAANFSFPCTNNLVLGGVVYAFTDIPIALPEQGVFVSIGDTNTAAIPTSGATLYQAAAARGNQGATTLATNPRKGAYTFWAYLAPTVVGTLGPAVQVNAIFTDDSGTTRTVPVLGAGVDITTLTGQGGETTIESNGATNVQFSVTGVTTQGALQYSLRTGIRVLSAG